MSASRSAAPPVVAPPSGHPRFPQIDSLRAIAALLVVVAHTAVFGGFSTHTWWGSMWNHLTIGVPIFFVISGFLLYRPFLASQVLGLPATAVGAYAWRRALRIVPAYWLALTVLGLWVHLHGVFTPDWWRYYLFLQVYSTHTLYGGILPAWTLCVEVSFYVLLPVYAAAVGRAGARFSARPRLRFELVVLAVLAVGSLTLRTIDLAGPRTVLDNTLLENFDWFAAGMALAVISVAAQDKQPLAVAGRWVGRWPLAVWAGAVALYAIIAGTLMNPVVLSHGIFYETPWGGLAQHIGFGLVALLFVSPAVFPSPRGVPARVLRWRTLAWLGLISYGIYLWHDPLLGKFIAHGGMTWWPGHAFLVLTAATALAAVAAAAASYYVVERPILAFKTFIPRRRQRAASTPASDRGDAALPGDRGEDAARQGVPRPGEVHRSGARH